MKDIEQLIKERDAYKLALQYIAEPYWELSYDKIRLQRDDYKKTAMKVLEEYWVEESPVEPKEMSDDF